MVAAKTSAKDIAVGSRIRCRPGRMIACLVAGDALVLALSGALVVFVKLLPNPLEGWHDYLRLAPLLPIFLLIYWALGLYSGVSLGPPEEVRRLTLSSILVTLGLGVMTYSTRGTHTYLTWTMAQALALTVILLPLTRVCIRLHCAPADWWGYETVVFGDEEAAGAMIQRLIAEPGLGLKPVGFISTQGRQSVLNGVPF